MEFPFPSVKLRYYDSLNMLFVPLFPKLNGFNSVLQCIQQVNILHRIIADSGGVQFSGVFVSAASVSCHLQFST